MKKWRCMPALILVLAMTVTLNLTVKATNDTLETEIDETIGIIEIYDGDFLYVLGDALTYNGLDDIAIQIGDAPIYDLLTGLPACASSILAGMEVRAAYIRQADEHAQAIAIWLNPSHEDAAVFSTVVSDNIYYGPDYTVFLSADGRYRVTLTLDTYIYVPGYGEISPEDIMPGQKFFVWVDMITASSPALVFPDKVVNICQYQ